MTGVLFFVSQPFFAQFSCQRWRKQLIRYALSLCNRTREGFEIALDRTKAPTRQLFSLGHELGHLFVDLGFANPEVWRNQTEYVESYARSGYDEEEFVAHEFAASLLMPRDEFTKLVHAEKRPLADVAKYFGVSHEAALMRGRWLGILPWS